MGMNEFPYKIVSGGQTGADRAALDFAIIQGIPHGGWCPNGRIAEDGPIDKRYRLQETPSADYLERTEWNVRDSDGTVIFSIDPILRDGSKKTMELAKKLGKPCLHLPQIGYRGNPALILQGFIQRHKIHILNVAGSRASKEATIGDFVTITLENAQAKA